MKKFLGFILLLLSMNAWAQDEIAADDKPAKQAVTAMGKPVGKIVEDRMDKDGGTIISKDGKVELIVPQGALSKKTTISIQSVTNLAPNGNGLAYRLEPSGILFKKNVQLVFHYDPEESADSLQLLLGIAMQDEKGQWFRLKNFILDTVAKTIRGEINHFSSWTTFESLKMYPSYARVKVGKKLPMSIDVIESEDDKNELAPLDGGNSDANLLAPLTPKKFKASWSVNNVPRGNSVVGTITGYSSIEVTYTAPALVPAQNPVAVSAKLEGVEFKYKGVSFRNLKLVSNILIYDNAYEVKMISSMVNAGAGSQLGKSNYKDTGSFVVSLEKGAARVIERVNKNASDEFDYTGRCRISLVSANYGNIHIAGIRSIKVTAPQSPNQRPVIEISFIQVPTRPSTLRISCPPPPGSSGGWTTMNSPPPPFPVPAYPVYIKFEAKEDDQVIYELGTEGSELFVRFTVKQIKED